jgi:hypothetical protein
MVLTITLIKDWGTIEQQHQKEMSHNNIRENASRISHHYKVGDKVVLKKSGKHLRRCIREYRVFKEYLIPTYIEIDIQID